LSKKTAPSGAKLKGKDMKELIFSDLRKGDKFIDKDGDPWVKLEFFNCAKAALENKSAEGSFYFSDDELVRKI